jgi:GT2 family glycosyltransferase
MLFFENNFWNPQVLAKSALRLAARCCGYVSSQIGLRKYDLMRAASHSGFTDIDVIPYDLIHPLLPSFLVRRVQSMAFVIEHAPLLKELCGTLYIWARKPGHTATSSARLSTHSQFRKAVSFVIPCHNEEMNIGRLVDAVLTMYGAYVHEMIIVNDNSSDGTARVAHALSERDPRIRSIDRNPPNGVGRALRDGCAAATGEYILMMDCDFVQIVPELRDLFDAVAEGYDGAIGSRFTHESIMMNYPFAKILCNRTFHFLANVALSCHVHDVSNNLKLYRAEILKTVGIEQPHFAANAEIGLRPILAGYRIKEVPISWINRAHDMGASSFYLPTVAPGYVWALWKLVRSIRELRRASAAERALRCARTHEGPTRLK